MQGQHLEFTIIHYCNAHCTHEEFIKWIIEDHIPLDIPIFKEARRPWQHACECSRYVGRVTVLASGVQFVTPPTFNSAMKEDLGKCRPAWDFADFDCSVECVVPAVQVDQKRSGRSRVAGNG
jgi:hypothetical protein